MASSDFFTGLIKVIRESAAAAGMKDRVGSEGGIRH